jgi:peptidoglycan/xylan/chitin deacetylase (PgdA/CDA1 family)
MERTLDHRVRISRRTLLHGVALAGSALAGAAGATAYVEATLPTGPADRDAAAVPAWPEARLMELLVIWRVATRRRAVALTFDDGPSPRWTSPVIDLLGEAGARATFFCSGQQARRYPELVRRATEVGEVGNHGWRHVDLARLHPSQVQAEIEAAHRTLTTITGHAPALLRPPYGTLRGPVLVAAARGQYRVVLWTDLLQRAGANPQADRDRLLARLAPGQILLAHDGRGDRAGTLQRLPLLLAGLLGEGFEVVAVGDLLHGAAALDGRSFPPGPARDHAAALSGVPG